MFLKKPINQNDHYIGKLDAPISIVMYGDYECSICAKADIWINEILREYGSLVVFVFRHYPLTYIHPHSAIAALAAEAAARENKFWEMHHLLYQNYNVLTGRHILALAEKLGIEPTKFNFDLESNLLMDDIVVDIMDAEDSGVETAPTYFLNGTKLSGIVNAGTLKTDIEHFLHEPQAHY